MAWEGSTRRARLPKDWPRIRLRILRRDGYACQAIREDDGLRCLAPANQVDHVVRGDDHSDANLQSLCAYHHGKKSGREGAAARSPRPSRARKTESHPGLK